MTAKSPGERAERRVFGVGALTLASLIGATVSFVVNLVTARALGPDGRGSVALVLQLAYIVAPLAGVGYPRALLRLADPGPGERAVSPGRTGLFLTLIPISVLAGFLYDPWVVLFAFVTLATVGFQIQRSRAIVEGTYRRYFGLFVGYQASILGGSVLLWTAGIETWQWWALVYALPGAAIICLSFGSGRHERNIFRVFRLNSAYIWSATSPLILMRSERLLLAWAAGSGELGIYVVVATATEPLYWVAQSLADSRTVSFFRTSSRTAIVVRLAKDFAVFSVMGLIGGGTLLLLLVPVFGGAYEPGRSLIVPLTLASVILASYRQAAGVALARAPLANLSRIESLVSVLAVIIYVVAIAQFGMLGAAWASVLVYTVGFTMLIGVGLRESQVG